MCVCSAFLRAAKQSPFMKTILAILLPFCCLEMVPCPRWRTEEYLSGYFGLQLHKGQKGRVLWRNLKIKPL